MVGYQMIRRASGSCLTSDPGTPDYESSVFLGVLSLESENFDRLIWRFWPLSGQSGDCFSSQDCVFKR